MPTPESTASSIAIVAGTDMAERKINRRKPGLRQGVQLPEREMEDRVLSYPEAEAIACVSRDTLLRESKAGRLKIIRLSLRRAGIRKGELLRWIASREALTASA
jgi:hypothetical protein